MMEVLNEILQLTSTNLQNAKQILKNTEEMTQYIESDDVGALTQAIALRQKWMEVAENSEEKIQEILGSLYKMYPVENLEEINQKHYPQAMTIIRTNIDIHDVYHKTYEVEQQNQLKAEELLAEYKGKVKGIQQGKQARDAYGKRSTGQSVMINQVK